MKKSTGEIKKFTGEKKKFTGEKKKIHRRDENEKG
jgi:hypothetical protein